MKSKIDLTIIMKLKEMIGIIWRIDKKIILIIVIETIISSISYFPLILFPKYVIDSIVSKESVSYILGIISIMIIFSLIINCLNIIFGNIRENLSSKMNMTLTGILCKKCMNIDYELYNSAETLDKSYYAYQVVSNNNFFFLLYSIRSIFTNIIVISGIIFLTVNVDYWILIVAFAVICIQSVTTSKVSKKHRSLNDEINPLLRKEDYVSRLANVITYRKDIITYNGQDFLFSKLKGYREKILLLLRRNMHYNLISSLVGNVISQLYQFTTYAFLALKALTGVITIGDFSMYLNALNTFVASMNGIISNIIDIKKRIYYFDKYIEFMTLEGNKKTGTLCIDSVMLNKSFEIEFKNVYFKYPNQEIYVLKNINLTIHKNEKIAIVGENGAGKSTFIMLLMRLYDPTEGEILLNGVNIKDIMYNDYVKLYSTVFQEFQIFGFTVIDNILLKENISEEEKNKAIQLIYENGLDLRVNSMKYGFETYVTKYLDDGGEELSGGELQKLAIIRALSKDSAFLIMDEPTSSLDPLAEYNIYQKFSQMTHDKTAVYISHRLASTHFCDKIIVFSHGEVIEQGNHEQLMQDKNTYYDMFSKQSEFYQ